MQIKKLPILLALAMAIMLVGCAPQPVSPPIPDTGSEVQEMQGLRAALIAEGAAIENVGAVEQPFFPVAGQMLQVNGAYLQVFEFQNEDDRGIAAEQISSDGALVGEFMPAWQELPNFWSQGRLIVLYIGRDPQIIALLSGVLGEPITTHARPAPGFGDTSPDAVREAVTTLSAQLGVPVSQVTLVSFEQVEWPDSCLGSARVGEGCADVITPGYRVLLEVNGQSFEIRTDDAGTNIRRVP